MVTFLRLLDRRFVVAKTEIEFQAVALKSRNRS
jgi:hypothetical protein